MATMTEMQLNKPPQGKTGRAKENRKIPEKTWKSLPLGQTARSSESFRVPPSLPILAKKSLSAYNTSPHVQACVAPLPATDATGRELRRWDGNKGARLMTYAPDGKVLAMAADRMIEVRDAQSGKAVVEVPRWTQPVSSPRFAPDDHRLLVACQDGFTASYDPRTGKAISRLLAASQGGGGRVPSDIAVAEISPDARKAVLLDRAGTIHIWGLSSAKKLRAFLPTAAGWSISRAS
jgi:WD40 repeat protein